MDFVFGKKKNPQAVDELVQSLRTLDIEGSLYIGYPIFEVNENAVLTDALMVTKDHGVVVFDLSNSAEDDPIVVEEYQDDLYRGLVKRFLAEKGLVNRRDLSIQVNVLSFRQDILEGVDSCTPDTVVPTVQQFAGISDEQFKLVNASIQKTSVLKPTKKRTKVKDEGSLGSTIKKIEKEIANLDRWQKKAAIESPDKPQRIRGLAGSGKTIILAMKAAYLHAYNPELVIAVTFQSRSLYQQLERLTDKFYFEHKQEDTDPTFLKIRHAWGSTREVGIYSEICSQIGISPLNFMDAKQKYTRETAFEGACQEALDAINGVQVEPLYDYLLIDEAQDFPVSFFKLVYRFVRSPEKLIWAYDELQNLGNFTMLPADELFGCSPEGVALVHLENEPGRPQQDIMLPICYRNPPWTLTLALALGLGIYRDSGPIRMFPDPRFWKDIGFELVSGELSLGKTVSLQRSSSRTPDYFYSLMNVESAIGYQAFDTKELQGKWVAQQIQRDVTSGELEFSDILIVFPDAYTLNSESAYVMHELRNLSLNCHVVGKNSSQDVVFVEESIAITHIHRAKGNEAPMVYVMNAQYCCSGFDLGKKRNSLFTAITRAKAWVRITGVGSTMQSLVKEIDQVYANNFMLNFKYPTREQLDELENAYKDKSPDEVQELYQGFGQIKKIKRLLKEGKIALEDLPDDLRDIFE